MAKAEQLPAPLAELVRLLARAAVEEYLAETAKPGEQANDGQNCER